MERSRIYVSSIMGALVLGCAGDGSGGMQGTVTTGDGSGTMASEATVGEDPTMATAADGSSTAGEDIPSGARECDLWAQDCPEGQKCSPVSADGGDVWDATRCVDVTGTDEPGDACVSGGAASGVDGCIKGAMCWGVGMDSVGTCVALCTGSPETPECAAGSVCTVTNDGTLDLCLVACDPLLQDCSKPGEACYPISDGFVCAPDASGEEGQANDPCEFTNVCDEGLMCADASAVGSGCEAGSSGCCSPYCEFPDGPCPNGDQQCVQFFDPKILPAGDPLLDIGVCGVPE